MWVEEGSVLCRLKRIMIEQRICPAFFLSMCLVSNWIFFMTLCNLFSLSNWKTPMIIFLEFHCNFIQSNYLTESCIWFLWAIFCWHMKNCFLKSFLTMRNGDCCFPFLRCPMWSKMICTTCYLYIPNMNDISLVHHIHPVTSVFAYLWLVHHTSYHTLHAHITYILSLVRLHTHRMYIIHLITLCTGQPQSWLSSWILEKMKSEIAYMVT